MSNKSSTILGLLLTAALFGLGELFARGQWRSHYTTYHTHPVMGIHVPNPNQHIVTLAMGGYAYELTTDGDGFRIVSPPLDAMGKNEYAILVLGDCYTFAPAVNDEFPFPQQLQTMLEAKLPNVLPGYHIRVVNAGTPWATIRQEQTIYNYLNPKRHYNLVILAFDPMDDLQELVNIPAWPPQNRAREIASIIQNHSALVRYFTNELLSRTGYTKQFFVEAEKHEKDIPALVQEYQTEFEQFVRTVRANGQQLILVDIYDEYPDDKDNVERGKKLIEDLAQKYNLPLVEPQYESQDYFKANPHFSVLGHYKVAKLLCDQTLNLIHLQRWAKASFPIELQSESKFRRDL